MKRFSSGYTLIELLIAAGILAIAVAGSGSAWMYGAQMSNGHLAGTLVALCVPVAAAVNWTLNQRSQAAIVRADHDIEIVDEAARITHQQAAAHERRRHR